MALALAETSLLAAQITEVVEARPTNVATCDDLDLFDARRVERENTLDADATGDLPDREGRACAPTALADHNAFEDLDTLLVTLPNTEVDVDCVAHPKREKVT